MSQGIITPDKYLTPDETKQLRKICNNYALLAKAKGIQVSVRDALKYKGIDPNLTGHLPPARLSGEEILPITYKLIFPPSNQTWP